MRSSGTSTRLMPLKLKSNSTRYVGGSAETRWTIVPSASCTFWLKATPLIVRPLRFTFTRWFGSNTPEPPGSVLHGSKDCIGYGRHGGPHPQSLENRPGGPPCRPILLKVLRSERLGTGSGGG